MAPEVIGALPRFDASRLSVEGTLGEGGMGVVHLARQREFGGTVAVKSLKAGHRTADARQKMLQEAWATGCLEHPQIVPVYALGLDDDDMPCLVLKHIEGDRWTDRLADPEVPADDHLSVLEDVAKAVIFAHDRGVVHRDLKPANVMVGAFHEVTLLDWGLAVAVDGGDARLPRAADERRMAGTPHYMAPEQLGDGPPCSRATDVYLLGALLFEIVHGRPPRSGPDVHAILDAVRSEEPTCDPALDGEVRALLTACFDRDPTARPTAVAFLERVRAWRHHRGARALAADASVELRALTTALAEPSPDPRVVLSRFGAARFGFEQARRAWPDAVPEGMAPLAGLMVRWHLEQGQVDAARWLLDDLDVGDPALRDEVDRAWRSKVENDARLTALAARHDELVGIRTRAFVLLVLSAAWVAAPLSGMAARAGWGPWPMDYQAFTVSAAVLTVAALALTTWARDSLSRSALNQSVKRGLVAAPLIALFASWWGQAVDLPVEGALAASMIGYFGQSTMVVSQMGWRYAPIAAGYLAGVAVSAVWPELTLEALFVANLIFAVNIIQPFYREAWRAYRDDT